MLTTIFSGHTLNLSDIVSVGPIMQESDGDNASMFIKIYLQHQIVFKHVHHTTLLRLFNEKESAKLWDIRLDDLVAKRSELIEEWETAIRYNNVKNNWGLEFLVPPVTADDRPRYTRTDKDLIAAHSTIISMLIDSPNFRQSCAKLKPKVLKLVESGRLTYSVKNNIVELFLENDQGGMELATWDNISEVLKKKGGEG